MRLESYLVWGKSHRYFHAEAMPEQDAGRNDSYLLLILSPVTIRDYDHLLFT